MEVEVPPVSVVVWAIAEDEEISKIAMVVKTNRTNDCVMAEVSLFLAVYSGTKWA